MRDRSSLTELLAAARRRCLGHLLLDQSALAAMVGMAGTVVLLLLGTQILDWYWIVLLAGVSFGAGLYRVRKSIPSIYQIAQRVDRRLNLADSLSTAAYFSGSEGRGDDGIRLLQRRHAEEIARSIDVRQAVPFVRPRYLYPALMMTALAIGMFALRYGVTGSLSLRPSLAQVAFDTFFPPKQQIAKVSRKQPDIAKTDSNASDAQQAESEEGLNAADLQEPVDPQTANNDSERAEKSDGPSSGKPMEKLDSKADATQKDDPNGQPSDEQQNGNQEAKSGSAGSNSNLMDKLRDVMANMMNKMTSSSQSSQPSDQKGSQSSKSDKQDSKGAQSASQNADAAGKNAQDQAQNQADASASDESADKTSPDGKSGIGSSDGDKKAREAEQLQAMGKISEILGKRSQGVTGDLMVEVGSGKQPLKTAWSQTQATHGEAGGEIHRDEVPLIYQQFVRQYFEEIRKTGNKPEAKKAQ